MDQLHLLQSLYSPLHIILSNMVMMAFQIVKCYSEVICLDSLLTKITVKLCVGSVASVANGCPDCFVAKTDHWQSVSIMGQFYIRVPWCVKSSYHSYRSVVLFLQFIILLIIEMRALTTTNIFTHNVFFIYQVHSTIWILMI